MNPQEKAHAIALIVGAPMLAVMMLERAQRTKPRRPKTTRTHHHDPKTYKIARPHSARTTTTNNRKEIQ